MTVHPDDHAQPTYEIVTPGFKSFHKKYYSVFKSPATMIETLTCFLKNFDSIEFKSFMISANLFMPGLGDV